MTGRIKIAVNCRLAPDVERLLSTRTIVLDDGGKSRNISQALQPLRARGNLTVGHDRLLGKSVLVIMGLDRHERHKRTGESVFELFLE